MQKVFRADKDELSNLLTSNNFQNVFLVRGGFSYEKSGAQKFIEDYFQVSGSFSGFDVNPQLEDLKKGIEAFKKGQFDCIVAIGGGSVLDMAKLISVFAHQAHSIEDLLKDNQKINDKKTSLLAIPTTAGTGAEATAFSVLYVDKVKYSIASKTMLPDTVYLSSEFLKGANKYLTACTGADAFSQAIESIWSINTNATSQEYALKAVDIIWKHLKNAVNNNDKKSKAKMLEASYLAGKAINISKTTAPHAISYAFTSYYGLPHGHAVSLSLPYFFEFNCNISNTDCIDPRGMDRVLLRLEKLLNVLGLDKNNVKGELSDFFTSVGLENNISSLINDFKASLVLDNVNIQRLKNNPRNIEMDDIQNFIKENNQ